MSRIAYVNGRYVPHAAAGVSIDDRAFVFGDGVYEVCEVRGGRLIDAPRHLARLERSLGLLKIAAPIAVEAIAFVLREVVARNRVTRGLVYVQVSRGAAPRDFAFPAKGTRSGLVVTAKNIDPAPGDARLRDGVKVVTAPDERWAHPHVKSLQLLPNVLAKQRAREAGAYECWLVDKDGLITEGASSNAWIVTRAGALVTRQADGAILRGVTRTTLLDAVAALGLPVEERPFSLTEALGAAEAFFSSATTIATPVVQIDSGKIADGLRGPITESLQNCFHEYAK